MVNCYVRALHLSLPFPAEPSPVLKQFNRSLFREHQMADENAGQKNIDIQHDPKLQDPNLPVEAVMEKAGKTEPVENQYADSPPDFPTVTSTHDRDSVQPPTPGQPQYRYAPEMPLKDSSKDGQ